MNRHLRKGLKVALKRLLDPLNVRVVDIAPTKVRGIDLFRDIRFLLGEQANPVVVDVGANDGETVESFLRAFPQARIVAVEPYEPCCALLQQRFGRSHNVSIHRVGLGADRRLRQLNVYSGHRMNSFLRLDDKPGNIMADSVSAAGSVDVDVMTLDGFCRELNIERIDVLKVDTQGYDLEVLRGAQDLLDERRICAVLVEVNFVAMYKGQPTFVELHGFLTSRGYRLVDFYNQVRPGGATAWCDACYVVAPSETLSDAAFDKSSHGR